MLHFNELNLIAQKLPANSINLNYISLQHQDTEWKQTIGQWIGLIKIKDIKERKRGIIKRMINTLMAI